MEKSTEDSEIYECTDCGSEVDKNADVCPKCGADFNREANRIVQPWSRWFSRVFDYQIVGFLIVFIIALIVPEILSIKFIFLNMLLTFIYVFVEASFLVMFGTTPGKFLLNIQLVPSNQSKFTFDLAIKRSFMVWIQGVGCGFPLATLVLSIIWYNKLKKDKITSWDKTNEINVIHKKNSPLKFIVFIILLLGIIFLNAYLSVIENQSQF